MEKNNNRFLSDFAQSDVLSKHDCMHKIGFKVSTSILHDSEGIIFNSLKIQYEKEYFDGKYIATIHINPDLSKPIWHLVELIEKHAGMINPNVGEFPLVLTGAYKIGEIIQGPFESFRPFILEKLYSVNIAFIEVPFDEIASRESDIIERLQRYIQG